MDIPGLGQATTRKADGAEERSHRALPHQRSKKFIKIDTSAARACHCVWKEIVPSLDKVVHLLDADIRKTNSLCWGTIPWIAGSKHR